MMMEYIQPRQGDVLLMRMTDDEFATFRKKLASGKHKVIVEQADSEANQGRVVLAYGEVTGHAHAIYSQGATLTEVENERFLEIVAPLQLDHEEHDVIQLAPGGYKVIQQVEYYPDEIRKVRD